MKTYYAPGLHEWVLAVRCGNARVIFHFEGGWASAHGSAPASYSTDNPAEIIILENSSYFKRGEIVLAADCTPESALQPTPEPAMQPTIEKMPEIKPESLSANLQSSTPNDSQLSLFNEENPQNSQLSTINSALPTFRDVHVACADDAKDYLETHYGLERATILTHYDLMRAAHQRNLRFVFGIDSDNPSNAQHYDAP